MQIGEGMVSRTYLQNGIVSKQYFTPFHKYTPRNIKWHWKNEIKALEKLKGFKHFPQLVSVDHSNHIIYMSYVGEPLTKKNLPIDWKRQCAKIESILVKKDIYHQDLIGKDKPPPFNKNIHVKDGVLYIIDFGIYSKEPSKDKITITEAVNRVAKHRIKHEKV